MIAVAALMVTTQVPVPEQPPPLHPAKVEPLAADAVSVTVPASKLAEHVRPQLIPEGAELTVPEPDPVFEIVSVNCGAGAPTPERGIVDVPPFQPAVRVPERFPSAVGVKFMSTWQFPPAGTLVQLCDATPKSPVLVNEVKISVAKPGLVKIRR